MNDTPKTDEIWTTNDGRKLLVGEMEEAHVRDALRLVIRRAREKKEKLLLLQTLARLSKQLDDQIHEERSWGSSTP